MHYHEIKIIGDFSEVMISDLRIVEQLNDHSKLLLTGTIPEADQFNYATQTSRHKLIKVVYRHGRKTIPDCILGSILNRIRN